MKKLDEIAKHVKTIDESYTIISRKITEAYNKVYRLTEALTNVHVYVRELLSEILLEDKERLTETLYRLIIDTYEIKHVITEVEDALQEAKSKGVRLDVTLFNLNETLKEMGKKDE